MPIEQWAWTGRPGKWECGRWKWIVQASLTTMLLKQMGIRGQVQQKAVKEFATAAKENSHWQWLKCKDGTWAANRLPGATTQLEPRFDQA